MNRENVKIVIILLMLGVVAVIAYLIHWQSSLNEAEMKYLSDDWESAEEMMLSNLDKFPDFLPHRSIQYLRLGEIYFTRRDNVKSEKYFHLALNEYSEKALPNYRLGIFRNAEGRYDEAIKYFRDALKSSGLNETQEADLRYRLAEVAFRFGVINYSSGKREKAEELFKLAVDVSPDFAEAYHYLGRIAFMRREYAKAWKYYEQALELSPELTILYRDISKILHRMKRPGEARKYEKKYRELVEKQLEFYEEQTLLLK